MRHRLIFLLFFREQSPKIFKKMKRIFVVAALIYSSLVGAQEDTSSKTLSDVVVTANRFPQKQNTTGKVVTVISQEVLSRSVGKTVPELLNQQAGLTILGSQNNLGTNQDVFLQGASSGKTLILIDGIPAYDPSTISTAFDINHFPIDNIERIEIVRGALSTLYGSDAVAGVINIITKKGGGKPLSFYGTASAGSYGTFKGVAGINGAVSKSRYNLQYSRLQAHGFSSAYDSTDSQGFDKDEFEQDILSGSFSTSLKENFSVRFNGSAGKYKTGLDAGAFQDERDYTSTSKNYQAGSGLEYRFNKGTVKANYNYNNSIRDYLDVSTHVGGFAKLTTQKYVGRSHVAELFTTININDKLNFLVGGDYRNQNTDQNFYSISSFGPYESKRGADSTKMNQKSLFATVFLKDLGGLNVELGGRYNNHSAYGDNLTYSFNPSYLINDN
jgi:vitamin B12 transporter